MRRMLKLLIVMFILYFCIQYLYYFLGKGHTVSYTVNNDNVTVEEILTSNKDVSDGYYFNIKFDNYSIPFKVLKKYNKQKRVLKSVDIYYGDIYTCIDIHLKKDEYPSDIKCLKDGVIFFYNNIKGQDSKLDALVSESNYPVENYIISTDKRDKDSIRYYSGNYVNNYNVVLGYYKGVYLFGNSISGVSRQASMFIQDQYSKDIEGMVNEFYIVADYNSSHEFYDFNVINVDSGANFLISSTTPISFSSFIQGSKDGKLYLIDCEKKKQYAIDPKRKRMEEVGNENIGALVLKEDGWETKNMSEVIDGKIKFYNSTSKTFDDKEYALVKKIGNNNATYYLYVKSGNLYNAYLVYEQDEKHTLHYLFNCTDINRIQYKDGYVFYLDNEQVKIFGTNVGNKPLIEFKELKYNEKLNYYVY